MVATLADLRKARHWSGRFSYIESLKHRRPIAASVLRSVLRLATSLAKRLN
jgi:hypothetical protein